MEEGHLLEERNLKRNSEGEKNKTKSRVHAISLNTDKFVCRQKRLRGIGKGRNTKVKTQVRVRVLSQVILPPLNSLSGTREEGHMGAP